ncbi:MAG: Tc toxin subunit A [Cyanobacteria bacterium P01_H01_bin.21]
MNTSWQGTWNSSRGELRFYQKDNRVYGDYAHIGLIEATYNPETKVLQGIYIVGTQGQINFTLNDTRFTGEVTWEQNGEPQRGDWTGEKQSDDLPELTSYAAIGTWETNRGTLKFRQVGTDITGTLGENKTLTGQYTFNAETENTESFRSIEGKLIDQNSEENFSIRIEKTEAGEWRFTEIIPASAGEDRQPWQGQRVSNQEPDLTPIKQPDKATIYTVSGNIISHELRGVSGVTVVAVDKNVGQEVQLGQNTSGERGAYEIRYSVATLQKSKPDVQVKAINDSGETLAVSAIRYDAAPIENELNILIPAGKLPQPVEYQRLIGELGAQLGNPNETQLKQRLAQLKEDDDQQDITYLANKTGWDARMVAMTSLANQFGERSNIDPEFYYALFRAGAPANEAVLAQMSLETVQRTWEQAVEQKIVPAALQEKIPENLARFKVCSVNCLLEEPAQIGVSNLPDLIAGALEDVALREVDPDQKPDQLRALQQQFATLYHDQRENPDALWEQTRQEFGPDVAERLQLDSKLSFLTTNNAPLIRKLHTQDGGLTTPLDLVRRGLYRQEAWTELLDEEIPIPNEIVGEKAEEKKANYAAVMSSQLRLSYPTAVVAEMVRTDAIPLNVDAAVKNEVTGFLNEHQDKFELGVYPIAQYLHKNNLSLEKSALAEVNKLERVRQISPSEEIMGKLLEHKIDSAFAVARFDEATFIESFKEAFGDEKLAKLTYAKAHQVHNAVLNITTQYLQSKSNPPLGIIHNSHPIAGLNNGNGNGTAVGNGSSTSSIVASNALTPEDTGVLAYSTLEEIFGEMDYCACQHCRSVLSPAAYLVDLLQFIDPPTYEKENPLNVLLEQRRPDIQHLQLTCENTNTVIPYIDLVNEILEHYVVNGSLDEFTGFNIEENLTTEELLANPQFVNDSAYLELRNQIFPAPLPFHQPLEELRRYFEHIDIPLHRALARLRQNDDLERSGSETDSAYGWQDILMERLNISRLEYAIFTDENLSLQTLYGKPDNTAESQLIDQFSNAKTFARWFDLSYEELNEIIRTRFINPHSHLIPKLKKLGVDFVTIQNILNGSTNTDLAKLFPLNELDMVQYGGTADQSVEQKVTQLVQWLQNNADAIMGLIVLWHPADTEDICSFDHVELRYARPELDSNKLKPIELLKLVRFIRLWRKLGWSIEQTDKALTALYPTEQEVDSADNAEAARTKLDEGFQALLMRLAHLQTVMEQLNLNPRRDLLELLACWSTIDTQGHHSLYRQMFLNPAMRSLDDVFQVFQEDVYGNYLQNNELKVEAHGESLRAAFNLTQAEFTLILQELNFGSNTALTLEDLSKIFRYGYLARKLRLSIQEFLSLKRMSGLDPFLPLDLGELSGDNPQTFGSVRPSAIRFIELANSIKDSPLNIIQLLYFLQHIDLSGSASPANSDILAFAQTLRDDLLRIEREHIVEDDPTGEIAKTKMALVYGVEVTDVFFGLLNNTAPFNITEYTQVAPKLAQEIADLAKNRIIYDHFQKQLGFRGIMTDEERINLKAVASATPELQQAIEILFEISQTAFSDFFNRHPKLKELYDNFVNYKSGKTSPETEAPKKTKWSELLVEFLPDLRSKLKQQQILQTLSGQTGADLTLLKLLLSRPHLEDASLLHAVGTPESSAYIDFNNLEQQGLSAETNGVWRGFIEAPDNGFYNFYIEIGVLQA